MKRRRSAGVLWVILLLCFMAPAVGALSPTKEIRIADTKGDWGYPNPYRHYPRGPGYIRMSWVFDTLVWKDNGGYVPALAQAWSYQPDRMTYTFKLDPRAVWHDGRPLTARDVAFSVAYFKEHPYPWIGPGHIGKVDAIDSHTVVFHMIKPYSPLLSDIGGTMPVLPEHIWKTVTDPKKFNDPKAFVGSGPYRFIDFNKAQGTYLFEAFDDYYQGRPGIDRLIYVKTGKPLVSLITGQVDLAAIKPEMADALEKKGLKIIKDEYGWNKKLMINHRKAPFNSVDFRRALALAIDKREIIDKAHRGFAVPASYGLLSMDHDMYNPDTPTYPHDPVKARALLETLGYQKGSRGYYQRDGKPLKVELLCSNIAVAGDSVADRDGEIIKKHLEAVGIQVELVQLEQATTDSRVRNWDFDLAVSGHGGIAGDPRILNEMISSRYGAGSVNCARYDTNETLNRLIEAQMTEMNENKRKEIVYAIQKIHAEELPAICLYCPDTMAAFNPKKGVNWFYTKGGISKGIPIPQNKMSLIR